MINVPDIFEPVENSSFSETKIDQFNLNFYKNALKNLYEMAVCDSQADESQDFYLLKHGIKPYLDERLALDSLYN